MSSCWCGLVLALFVILFAWLPVTWANIALTVLGVILAVKALIGKCCCATMMEKAKTGSCYKTETEETQS